MKILKNPRTRDSFLFQIGEELLKVNLLLKQVVYFKKGTTISEMVFLNDWAEIDDNEMSEVEILERTKRLLNHLNIVFNEGLKLYYCNDEPDCFLLIGSGKIIQVDKKYNSLSDESDALFLESRFDMRKPIIQSSRSINLYQEIWNNQFSCISRFDVCDKIFC